MIGTNIIQMVHGGDPMDINIKELIKDGAKVEVTYFCKTMDEAYQKLVPYRYLGNIQFVQYNGDKWLELNDENLKMTAFLPLDY